MANPVRVVGQVRIKTRTAVTRQWVAPNVGAAAAYTSGDAIGGMMEIDVPKSGLIQSAVYWDRDDEGLQVDLLICKARFQTAIADNAAFTLLDEDLLKTLTLIQFSSFTDFTNGQAVYVDAIGKAYVAPEGKLYCQAIARGALNIAAGSEPMFQLDILADDAEEE